METILCPFSGKSNLTAIVIRLNEEQTRKTDQLAKRDNRTRASFIKNVYLKVLEEMQVEAKCGKISANVADNPLLEFALAEASKVLANQNPLEEKETF